MSQGVNEANISERRVPTKNERSSSIKKAGTYANIHPPMTFNTMSPASVPTLPSHINGRRYIEPQGAELNPGGAATAEVINIIKRNFNRPYHCWNKIPQPVRDTWFKEFMKKYWWYPENHDTIRCTFELVGYMQLKNLLSQARVNQRRPEWIEKSAWKQLCTDWAIKEPRSKIQLNEKIPLGGSTSSSKGKIKKEKYEQSRQSAIKDTGEENLHHRTPAEVKVVMDIMGEEFHEKVMKLIESVNQIWIQRVESLEREKEELKGFAQLYCNHWQNYENLNKDASLKGLSGKVVPIDNFSPPPPPPHHLNVSAFRPPHHPNAATVQPPPPPTQPKVAAFRPAPPHYHPNISTFPSQPYQLNPSAHQAPPSTSVYGFQGKQSLNKGHVYSIKDDEEEDDDDDEENDDDFSEEFSDYSMDALVM